MSLTAYYLEQLGISSWMMRSSPAFNVLIVLDEIEGDLQSWLLGREGRLLKKIISCIDLAWDQVGILCLQQDSKILSQQSFRTPPKIILHLGQCAKRKDFLEKKYPFIPIIATFAPRALIDNPLSKRTAYHEFQRLRQLLDSMP